MKKLPVTRVHHVALVTRQPEESAAFYRDVLGFRELERPPFGFRGAWLYNYGLQIHIIENESALPRVGDGIDTRGNHLALQVEDVDVAKATLVENGIAFQEQVNAGGIHQVFFHDPDGHTIEIAVYGPNPPEKRGE